MSVPARRKMSPTNLTPQPRPSLVYNPSAVVNSSNQDRLFTKRFISGTRLQPMKSSKKEIKRSFRHSPKKVYPTPPMTDRTDIKSFRRRNIASSPKSKTYKGVYHKSDVKKLVESRLGKL